MKAFVLPLGGKYYGTEVLVVHGDNEWRCKLWCNTGNPSRRELEGFDSLDEYREKDMMCDGHYESAETLALAERIVEALND